MDWLRRLKPYAQLADERRREAELAEAVTRLTMKDAESVATLERLAAQDMERVAAIERLMPSWLRRSIA
jgi:hypothetical protein